MNNEENEKKEFDEEVDDTLNSLFKSTMNIDLLKSQSKKSYQSMKSSDFSLEKELAQSKIIVNINEIGDENKYLKKKIWDSSDDNKIEYLESKAAKIFKEIDKKRIQNLIGQINKCNLDLFYKNFNPKFNDKTIGSISSLDFLIETTYNSNVNNYEIMIKDREELKPYINKFRSVLGDGDCFYRGFMFSLLENIILTNNIMLMKELLILNYEKINLKNELIKEKEYLLIFHEMNTDIVTQVLYILINQMENDMKKAYIYLLKLFLYCPDFDFGIIYFMRYLIFEYISANEDKIYSREFQVELGCLLPDEYCIDKGNKNEYLFENYFSLQLMKAKTFAEKIVIYITPYVFNVNMNILIYDFGINGAESSIQEKKFLYDNNINSQIQINLIFRKAHYDIYYKQNYYEEFKNYFNILENIKENIQIINKKEKPEIKEENNLIDIDNNDDLNNNKENLTICLECKKPISGKINEFFLCEECLLNNIKTALLSSYIGFIQNKSKNNVYNIVINLNQLIENQTFFISDLQGRVPINKALNNSKYKFKDIFLDVRSKICLNCGENLNSPNDYFIKLPCECRICTKKCFLNYMKMLKFYFSFDEKFHHSKYSHLLTCFCGFTYHTFDIIYMIEELDKRNLKEEKESYQYYIKNIWKWICMGCNEPFNSEESFNRVIFDTDKLDKKILKSKALKHLLCDNCKNKLNEGKVIFCSICEFEHEIKKIIKVDETNEEDTCSII